MRSLVLAVSVLASLAAPAFAATGRHHVSMPKRAGDFVDVAPAAPAPAHNGGYWDPTSPNLNANPHPCIYNSVCDY
jgi:hypothetical protein